MKTISSFLLILILLGFSSCQKEENLMREMEPLRSIPTSDSKEVEAQSSERCPMALITLSPCNRGFTFYATRDGVTPDTYVFAYEVRTMANVVVDTGTVSYGGNTNQVLNYCQQYRIIFYDWCGGGPGSSLDFTRTTDGCGGTFLC